MLMALRARGLDVVDGQQVFLEARRIKTGDEITLLTTAASMVDAAYDDLYAFLRPGVRENEAVGLVAKKALRPRVRARRGRQRDQRRALLAAPARLQRPADPARRPGVLRHPALVQRLPDLLLPHVRRGQRVAPAGRGVQALPRLHGRRDRAGATRCDDRRRRQRLADRAGVRLRRRGGGVRAAVRARRGALDLGEADLQPPGVARPPGGAGGGHGVRAGDLLAGGGRLGRGPHRGGASSSRRTAAR
nr:hypothetical protein [Angustibacter aerolatus]